MAGQSFAEWSGSNQSVAPTTPSTSPTPAPKGQSFQQWSGGTPLPSNKPMVFNVGEGLNPTQQNAAQDVLSKEVIPVGQTIKAPFVQAGITVPNGPVEDIAKGFVEFPEKAFRSLSYLAGLDKQTQDRRGKQTFQVPSYAEISGKTTGELIDQGIPPAAAVILGSAQTAGQFANDALMYLDPFAGEGGALKSTVLDDALLKTKTFTHTPEATKFFNTAEVKDIWQTGKVLSEADKGNILKVIGGDSAKIKEAINNGISIKVPASTLIQLEDKPYWAKIKDFFGIEPASPKLIRQDVSIPVQTVRGYLNEGALVAPTIPEVAPLPEAPISAPTPTPEGIPTAPTTAEALQMAEARINTNNLAQQIKDQGGVTLDIKGGEVPNDGYVYSPDKTTEFSLPEKDFGDNHIDDYIEKYYDKLSQDGMYLGAWVDNGKVYLDVSRNVANEHEAVVAAKSADQLGIYDVKNGQTKYTNQYKQNKEGIYQHEGPQQGANETSSEGSASKEGANQVNQPDRGTSKIAKSVETKAVEAGLTKGFSDLAGYDKITIKDQSEKATKLVNENIQDARAILRGEKELPNGLKGTAVIKAIEDSLLKNPDSELAYELANSKLITGTSEAAQELRLAAERDPDSATAKIQEIKKAREAKAGKVKTEKVKRAIRKVADATREVNLDKADLDWDNFLNNELAC